MMGTGKPVTKITLAAPQPKQEQFLEATAKYVAYGGARGGGKSWAVRMKAQILCFCYPGYRALILRRTYQELLKNHIQVLQRELYQVSKYNGTEKTLTFLNGSTIEFGYCKRESDVERYRGLEYDAIFLDEGTFFTYFQFRTLAASVRGIGKVPRRMYITCNPGGVGHAWVKRLFVDRLYEKGEDPSDYVFIPAKVDDNPILMEHDPDYVKFLDSLPNGIREAWRDGDWDVFAGQFFTEFSRETHVVDPVEAQKWWRWYVTIDYGMDMLAAYLIAVDETGTAWVTDEAYEGRDLGDGHDGLIISAAATRLLKLASGRKVTWLAPPDMWNKRQESGKSAADIFRDNGIVLVKTSNNRTAGWFAVRERLKVITGKDGIKSTKLKIFRGCANLIRTLPLLIYDPNNPSDCLTEPHEITHAPDALRGFCVYWMSAPDKPGDVKGKWTKFMQDEYGRAGEDLRSYLRTIWGDPPS